MEEKLVFLVDKLWDTVWQGSQAISSKNKNIKYNRESENKFKDVFKDLYCDISEHYMIEPEEPLDRHKVAAIAIVAIIKAEVLRYNKSEEQELFWGNYTLAVDSALTYMLSELNKRLIKNKKCELRSYLFPTAMSCKTTYYKIFCRNLYYAVKNEEWSLNPLDIAERLFLLEYITLRGNGIEPSILNEY